MKSAKPYIQENKQRFINELIDLLKIPSISADSNYKEDIINTNMQWRLCDCTLDKGHCLCEINNNDEKKI